MHELSSFNRGVYSCLPVNILPNFSSVFPFSQSYEKPKEGSKRKKLSILTAEKLRSLRGKHTNRKRKKSKLTVQNLCTDQRIISHFFGREEGGSRRVLLC